MPNKNYLRGRRAEYQIVEELLSGQRDDAWAQRMAGSHSPYDVIAVYPQFKEIVLVQSKTKLVDKDKPTLVSEQMEDKNWTVRMYKETRYVKRRKA